jgi:branched-chain amino acid transport system permease protein
VRQFLAYTVSGLATAAIYAVAASGLVLTYTTTGTFNFGHGAIGMIAAFTYWELRFGWHWPAPIALVVCVGILAPLYGIALERFIMRRLEGAAEVTRLMATVSLTIGMLGASLWIWSPDVAHPIRTFWQGRVLTLAGVRIPFHQIAVLVIAALVAVGLRLLLYRARIGVAMRATVDDRSLVELNGGRPDRASMLAWALGASLAALAGVLISPTLTLTALPLTLLIINAYAAAMIGRLRSLPRTFVGALILGLANDYSLGYLDRFFKSGAQYLQGFYASIPVIVLFIVLLVLPTARLRGHAPQRVRESVPNPTWQGTLVFVVVVVIGAAMAAAVIGASDLETLSKLFGIGIIGLSLIPLVGYAGQISLCQLAFAGIGAMVMAHLGRGGNPVGLLLAGVVTGGVGALVALPALRLRGIYLALATAAFAVAMDNWVFNFPKFTLFHHDINLFENGSLNVARLRVFGLRFEGQKSYFILMGVAFALCAMAVLAVRRSPFGLRLLAMKDSPAACATLGMGLTATKLAVFSFSAALAGIGGALYGGGLRTVDASVFSFFAGLSIIMIMVIAGVATIGGALACGILLGAPFLSDLFPTLRELQLVLTGLAGIGMANNPNGFVPDLRRRYEVLRNDVVGVGAVAATVVALWALRMGHVIGSWALVIATMVVLAAAPLVGEFRAGRARARARAEDLGHAARVSVPLEWVGIDAPFTPEVVAELDAALAWSSQ